MSTPYHNGPPHVLHAHGRLLCNTRVVTTIRAQRETPGPTRTPPGVASTLMELSQGTEIARLHVQYSPCNYSGYWGWCAQHPDASGGHVTSGCVLKGAPHQAAHQTISILYANQKNPWKLPQALRLDRVLSERSTRIHQP